MMQWYEKRRTLVTGFIILSLITGFSAYSLYQGSRQQRSTSYQGSFGVDKTTSQEEEVNPGRTDESYGTNPATPALIGFDAFINQGITESDLAAFQAGLSQYFIGDSTYAPNSKVALSNPKCLTPDEKGVVACTYILVVNDKINLTGTMRTDLSGPISYTISRDGKQIYNGTQQPKI